MHFIQQVSPTYIPPSIPDRYSLSAIREQILQAVLLVSLVLGLPLVVMASLGGIARQEYYLPFLYLGLYVAILVITVMRRLPFSARGNAMTFLIFLLALSELAESGQIGEVRMIMLAYIALTATLFNYKNTASAILISLAAIISVSIYVNSVPVPFLPSLQNVRQGTDWATSSLTFLMLSLIISGSITMIIAGLETNLKKQAELTLNLSCERDSLESRIQDRTQHMARRMAQLHAATEVSHTISALQDPEMLLQQLADLIKERFNLYYVGIFLLENTRQFAILQAGTGEAGKIMRATGHQLSVNGSSMIGWCITHRKSRIALDVGTEAVRFNNPNLPLTRSELALPIIAHDTVLGAMTIQSNVPNAFDADDISVLESITASLAIALDNDRLYKETRQSLEEIRTLNREFLQRTWTETIDTYGELAYDYHNPGATNTSVPTHTVQIPLMLRDEVIGQIDLEMDHADLSEDEAAFVENITTQTAVALENARLLYTTERQALQEQKLNELAAGFSRAMNIDEILRAAAQELGRLPSIAEVSVQLDPTGVDQKPANLAYPWGDNGKEHHS